MNTRTVPPAVQEPARIVKAEETREGPFVIRRPIPQARLEQIDPFLMLDEFGPVEVPPNQAAGFPEHPHKGFEIITYNLAGEGEHRDTHGNHGILRDGDLQWMVAGAGIAHEEMPTEAFVRSGGLRHGFQMWVNLSRENKKLAPRYKDVRASEVPLAHPAAGATARVIAGQMFGASGPIHTVTPWAYAHVTLEPGAAVAEPVNPGWTSLIYVFAGTGLIGATRVVPGDLAVFDKAAAIGIRNGGAGKLEALLLSAEPIGEPVARYGPFVMNTRDELASAFEDYRAGRFGRMKPLQEP